MNISRHLIAASFLAALGAAVWRAPNPETTTFSSVNLPAKQPNRSPLSSEWVFEHPTQVRNPSLSLLADGRLALAWVGQQPGNEDAETIWFAVRDAQGWSDPQQIANRESTAGSAFVHVDRMDSPVLHSEGSWLHLWYAASASGQNMGRNLYHTQSTDGGKHWSAARRLSVSPWPVGAAHLAAPPVALADGGLGLPLASHAFGQHAEWLRLSATGKILDKQRLPAAGAATPAVQALDEQHAVAVFSAEGQPTAPWQMALSEDAGLHWQTISAGLPASPTPLALLRLDNGKLLLAGNPESGRQTLQLWLSGDQGQHWIAAKTIETANDSLAEFTHPTLQQARDGRIHLVYAWRRKALRHVAFDPTWLEREE